MEYKVVSAWDNMLTFVELVNVHIAMGWQPQGGVSTSRGGATGQPVTYYQAMVKIKDASTEQKP